MVQWYRVKASRPPQIDRLPLAFETFFRVRFRPLVRFIIISESATREEAEDAVEDAMHQAYRKWSDIQNPEAWVRRAAKNSFIKHRERDRERQRLSQNVGRMTGEIAECLTTADQQQQVLAMLKSLPPAQREVMAYVYDDFSPSEIATMIDKDPQTVRSNLRAARRALAAMVRAQDDRR